ncbi:MAG: hypothetical protein KGS72_06835 [Cyanobacteria bacterium REEB67]|nr:hypothetical protein [Cyanobacteria bacterium REEB67]
MTIVNAQVATTLQYTAKDNVLSITSWPYTAPAVISEADTPFIDEANYRKLIALAVRYEARFQALKPREIKGRYFEWCLINEARYGSTTIGDTMESFWRNKNLYVRRISRRDKLDSAFVPEQTQIACLFTGGARLLLTIEERNQKARFEVIEHDQLSGYCLDGLDYDLALSQVFSLLKEIEGLGEGKTIEAIETPKALAIG